MLTPTRVRLAATVVAVVLLSGCSTTDGSAPSANTSTPTPSAVEEAPAAATTLQFSASDVRALDATGESLSTVAFDEGSAAVVELVTETVGAEPVVYEETEEGCAGPHTSYQWDGAVVTAWTGSTDFIVGLTAPSLGGIRLETTGGFATGDDITAFAAAAPPENVGNPADGETTVAFDVVARAAHDGYSSPVGAIGWATDGILQSTLTPSEWSSFYC